jgi:hypothetical protein
MFTAQTRKGTMKAKEWVAKLQNLPESEQPVEEKFADFLKEYGEETATLVAERTKFSKPESKFSASEGAVREQRNKFQSICGSVTALKVEMFDAVLDKAFPEWKKMVEAQQKKQQQQKKKEDDDHKDGRRFGNRNRRR